jgi:hypothetical protein
VYGTTGLRFTDASVFPHLPGFFIMTAIAMVLVKAAGMIPPLASLLYRRSAGTDGSTLGNR